MTAQTPFEKFLESTKKDVAAPSQLSPTLQALWHDARGDWEGAHELAQAAENADGAWVHAYLHRKEGDAANAAYWYRRAGQPIANGPLDAERTQIAQALLARATS